MLSNKQSAHWSQDAVGHLRTVHFALITVSTALLVLLSSARTYKPAKALGELENILRAQKSFDPKKLIPIKGKPFVITLQVKPKHKTAYTLSNFSNLVPLQELLDINHQRRLQGNEREPFLSDDPLPNTIGELRSWWNERQSGRTFLVLPWYRERVFLWNSKQEAVINTLEWSKVPNTSVETDFILPPDTPSRCGIEAPSCYLYVSVRFGNSYRDFWKDDTQDLARLGTFKVKARLKTIRNHDIISGVNDQCFEFKTCFPNIAKASEGMENLPLEDLRENLVQQVDKGGDVLEVVGLKLPVENLTFWGAAVLLGVQLYLLIHLHALNSKLRPGDPGWDVAWVGIYQSSLAKSLFFTSVVIFPLSAIGMLMSKTELFHRDSYLLCVALIISDVLCLLTWRHRPQTGQFESLPRPIPDQFGF